MSGELFCTIFCEYINQAFVCYPMAYISYVQ